MSFVPTAHSLGYDVAKPCRHGSGARDRGVTVDVPRACIFCHHVTTLSYHSAYAGCHEAAASHQCSGSYQLQSHVANPVTSPVNLVATASAAGNVC